MKKMFKDSRFYFVGIYGLINVALLVQLFLAKMIPMKFKLLATAVLVLVFIGLYFLQYAKRTNKINKILGKIVIVIMSVLLLFGNVYMYTTFSMLNRVSGDDEKTIQMSVVVMKDSKYDKLEDLKDSIFGTISVGELKYTEEAVKDIEKDLNQSIVVSQSDGFAAFAEALYTDEVQAIVLNEGYRGMFEDNHPKFNEETKVIKSYTYTEKNTSIKKAVNVSEEPFLMYISGLDTYGGISTVSRSDVNKIMAVNPKTRQILLIDIPRDYYVPQVCQGNQKDKLTHTGIFGVDCTVQSIDNFFGEDINYYIRVNFSSLVDIVNALGGVSVDSAYAFNAAGFSFSAGTNNLNGEEALAFSRERYSLPGGDNERIKNQSRVLSGIINKATSPAIITNYMGMMNAVGGSFQTNMSNDEISKLINAQLDDMRGWNIQDFAVTGTGGTDWTPANGFNAYVMYPDETSVATAKTLIAQLKNGEVPSIPTN